MKNTPPDGVIRVEFDKVSSITEYSMAKQSIELEAKGITWQADICLYKGGINGALHCLHDQRALWSIDVDAEIIIVNSDTSKNIL
ncbi:hypothetical protein PMAYCL1PPCAC_25252, partial [Pristionchus mayeri]